MAWTYKDGVGNVYILCCRQDKAEVAVCSNTKVRVHGERVCLDFIPHFVNRLICGFTMDRSEVSSLKGSVMVVDRGCHG